MVKKITKNLLPWSQKLPLRAVLVVPFLCQISVVVGLTGYLSFRNGQRAVNDLANQLRQEVTFRISQHLESYLATPHLVNQVNVDAFEVESFNVKQVRKARHFLWRQMKHNPTLKFMGIGTENSDYVGFERINQGLSFNILDAETAGITEDWLTDQQGNLTKILTTYANYDPQTRPWYQVIAKTGQTAWSKIYLSFGTEKYAIISANQGIYDAQGNLQGVATSSLSLSGISDFLSSLKIGKTGQTFIMEPNGLLVATSTLEISLSSNQKQQRLEAINSSNILISETAEYLVNQVGSLDNIQTATQLSFVVEGEKIFVQVAPFQDKFGLHWLIAIVVPESDFMAQIHANNRTTILLCLLALMVAIAMGMITSKWLVQPIQKMIAAADALSSGKWQHYLSDSSPHELDLLAKAFNHMSWQLQTSFAKLEYIAYHDSLTGLGNRTAFIKALKQAISETQQQEQLFAVLFLDLDGFKLVNDSLGHLLGDQLLVAVADRIQGCLNSNAVAARFGGDEFTILLTDITDVSDAAELAQQICQALNQHFSLKGHAVFISASIGIVLSSTESKDPNCFLRDADIAMYHAKAKGNGHYEVFDAPMHTETVARLKLETELRQGIDRGDFEVYYQPIVSLETQSIAGFEALIRWRHPTQGIISPGQFIPIAEETGLIVHLGEWVLQQACAQMADWQSKFAASKSMFMSINVSAKQLLQSDLLTQIGLILQQTDLSPENLKLEMTESIIVNNVDIVSEKLIKLRSAGVKLSIDDFGTGYSSLSYLHSFPFTTLKVDRSFVSRMNNQEESFEITKAIVLLAHSLGMNVIAEGIETLPQLAQLKKLGCEYGQGFLFASPMSANAVTERLSFDYLQTHVEHQ